jgi:hypothetical protein
MTVTTGGRIPARDGMHKSRQFIDIQLAIEVPVCVSELHFENRNTCVFETVWVAPIDLT